jgi:hypothetical protein
VQFNLLGKSPNREEDMAHIYALLGDADRAIPILKRLLQIRMALRLLRRSSGSIRCGIKSATIRAFRNWPQKRNRELEGIFAALKRCYFSDSLVNGGKFNERSLSSSDHIDHIRSGRQESLSSIQPGTICEATHAFLKLSPRLLLL